MSEPAIRKADPLRTTDHVPDPQATGGHVPHSASTLDSLLAPPPGGDAALGDFPEVPGYRVLGEIARGGMGRVLAAIDLSLDREVALKVLVPGAAADRFVRESKITARLPHPGIPPVHALGTLADGSPFLAMKLIAGRTLAAELKVADRARLLQAFEQICQAVGFAHSKGVIHRDLKPANVMVGAFGEVQVMDWGLAKELASQERQRPEQPPVADTPGSPGATLAGSIMGTPAYMAPEQARGEVERVGPRSDVFALGGILAMILTGSPPFRGKSTGEVILRAALADLAEAFARLDGCGADQELAALCKRCLSPEPADRPENGQAVAAAVAGYRAGVEQRLRAAEREKAAADVKTAEQRKRRRVQLALGGAVVLLLLGGGYFAWWQERHNADRRAQAAERRAEQDRNGLQIAALLDRCETAIADDDTAGAQLAVGEAEKRAENPGADHLKERLTRCRSAADVLVDLDRIDALLWGVEEGKWQGKARAVREWPGTFLKIGVVVGQTPPAQAAEAVNDSLARDRLLTALDLWLVYAVPADRAHVVAILAAADADPFRDALRSAVGRSDWTAVGTLAAKDEALRQPARFAQALAPVAEVPGNRRLAVLGAAARARPRDFGVLMGGGSLYRLNDPETAAERIAWYRGAVIVRPASANAHNSLGIALSDKGDLDEAIAEFREAIERDPKYPAPHNNLGFALCKKGHPDEAIAAYWEGLRLDPKSAWMHNGLGEALAAKSDPEGAMAEYREALKLDPNYANPHNGLGIVLYDKGDLDGAIAEYQEAIKLAPKYDFAHNNLGNALRAKGDLDGAIASYKQALQLSPKLTHAANALQQTERWRELLPRLADVAAGRGGAPAPAEACELATLAAQPFQRRCALAVRLFSAAFAADPKLADNLVAEHRYNAACCAALATARQGADTADLTAADRSALREKALGWIRADLVLRQKQAASADPAERKTATAKLSWWLMDADLAGTRAGASEEAAGWDEFWSDVRATLAKANKPPPKPAPPDK